MGADPLVSNSASASAWNAVNSGLDPSDPATALLQGFLVRKAEKTHGTGRRIEGFLKQNAPVVILDDVCTTGGSTITAIEAAREAGMQVAGVFCLVDREQGGRANIEAAAAGVPFLSVFTASDVRAAHIALKKS
jgi:orotate phosphoribosyltransferase